MGTRQAKWYKPLSITNGYRKNLLVVGILCNNIVELRYFAKNLWHGRRCGVRRSAVTGRTTSVDCPPHIAGKSYFAVERCKTTRQTCRPPHILPVRTIHGRAYLAFYIKIGQQRSIAFEVEQRKPPEPVVGHPVVAQRLDIIASCTVFFILGNK